MTDPTEKISQELDDILLDDLVEVQERTSGSEEPKLTPGQAVYEGRRQNIIEAEIDRISDELELPESTQQTAASLFDQYTAQEDITGNALEVLAAACLYTACKVESLPLSPDDFANVPGTAFTRVILLRRVKSISSTLGLDPRAFFDPTQYVDHYCDQLELDDEVAERAHEILSIADEAGIGGGKSPTGRAAAAIYNACLDTSRKVTQSEIGNIADVTEVTIRNRYQDQRELLTSQSTSPESESEPELESDVDTDSTDESSPNTVFESSELKTSDVRSYVGESLADHLVSALKQLEQPDEDLINACIDLCKRLDESGAFDELSADDVSLALAIIRRASMNVNQPISYPTLGRTLEGYDENLYRVTANLEEAL
jgi:transcription initiation factor TFIIIB Brf1 subunit/transcription initiation factor TFIIB